jgi:hypothetical protein
MAEIGEMRAQRLEACRREPNDCRHADDGWCGSDECNGDGTRWVTVGTLRPIGGNGKIRGLHDDVFGWPKRVPAYTIEETP